MHFSISAQSSTHFYTKPTFFAQEIAKIALETTLNCQKSPSGEFRICQIFSNSKLAIFRILELDSQKQKSPKSPTKPPKPPLGGFRICQIFPNSNLPGFRILDYQKHLNMPIFTSKIAKIAQNRYLAGVLLINMPFGSK